MQQEVRLAQQGDREAFIRLIRSLESELYSLAMAILRHEADCADALQEATIKAYKSLPTLRQPKYFKTWLIRILINECNHLLRQRKRTIVMAEVPEVQPVLHETEYDSEVDLREMVNELEDSLRIVIHLFYFQDLSIKQIANILDISQGAVKVRLYRARGLLADQVKRERERKMAYGT